MGVLLIVLKISVYKTNNLSKVLIKWNQMIRVFIYVLCISMSINKRKLYFKIGIGVIAVILMAVLVYCLSVLNVNATALGELTASLVVMGLFAYAFYKMLY